MRVVALWMAWMILALPGQAWAKLSVHVTLEQNAEAEWVASYEFSKPVGGFIFVANAIGHHSQNWTVLSDDTEMISIVGLDTVWFERPRSTARFIVNTENEVFTRTIQPARTFEDGNVIFSTDEFLVFPIKKLKTVEKLDGYVERYRGPLPKHQLTLKSDKPLHMGGQTYETEVSLEFSVSDDDWIVVGENTYTETDTHKYFVDRNLSETFTRKLASDVDAVLKSLSSQWGASLPEKPVIMVRAIEFEEPRYGARGFAVNGRFLLVEVSGNAFVEFSDEVADRFRKVLAHEIAHLFQGQNGVRSSGLTWFVEGSANFMAYDALRRGNRISEAFVMNHYANSYEACYAMLKGETDFNRGIDRARFYDCGDLIALITHKIAPDKTVYDVWTALHERAGGFAYTQRDYFKILEKFGVTEDQSAMLQQLIKGKIDNVNMLSDTEQDADILNLLMVEVGLYPNFNTQKRLVGLTWQ